METGSARTVQDDEFDMAKASVMLEQKKSGPQAPDEHRL